MKVVNIEQGTPEWHRFRKLHIGSSDAPIVMKVSPWSSPYMLWMRKLGLVDEQAQSKAMLYGTNKEEEARQKFMEMTGIQVSPLVAESDEYPWMSASFDGINLDYKKIVEIKCPGFSDHKTALNGVVPEKYYPQLQHQLAVSGYEYITYFSYFNEQGHLLNVLRDDDYIQKMIKEEEIFHALLKNLVAPELTNKDYIEKEDLTWQTLAGQYKIVKENLKVLETMESNLKKSLISLCVNQSSKGGGIKVSRILKKGLVNYGAIAALQGINLEDYRKPHSEYWKISVEGLSE